jgi:hypothetical protein
MRKNVSNVLADYSHILPNGKKRYKSSKKITENVVIKTLHTGEVLQIGHKICRYTGQVLDERGQNVTFLYPIYLSEKPYI